MNFFILYIRIEDYRWESSDSVKVRICIFCFLNFFFEKGIENF